MMKDGNVERQQAVQGVETVVQSHADLESDLKFSPENIVEAYTTHSAKFAYWAIVAAQAKSAMDKKKLELERQDDFIKKTLVGELDGIVRQQMDEDGIKITEAKVAGRIYIHPRYLEEQSKLYSLQNELAELQHQYGLLCAAKEAMVHRKDMLVSLGAQLRQEMTVC